MADLLDGAMGRREAADAGASAGAAQALAVASVVPGEALRSVAAHDGGCFALAFDRCACPAAVGVHVLLQVVCSVGTGVTTRRALML